MCSAAAQILLKQKLPPTLESEAYARSRCQVLQGTPPPARVIPGEEEKKPMSKSAMKKLKQKAKKVVGGVGGDDSD